mgnify:CR=1 FL=1
MESESGPIHQQIPALTIRLDAFDNHPVVLRAGIIQQAGNWASTSVSGYVSGSTYQGTGSVSGNIKSETIQHQRIFVRLMDDESEMAIKMDNWNLPVRPGHIVVFAVGPRSTPSDDGVFAMQNCTTGQVGPTDDLALGYSTWHFMKTPLRTVIIRALGVLLGPVGLAIWEFSVSDGSGFILLALYFFFFHSIYWSGGKGVGALAVGRRVRAVIEPQLAEYGLAVKKLTSN